MHTNELDLEPKTLSLIELSRLPSAHSGPIKILDLNQDKQLQYSIIKLDTYLEPNREYLLSIDFTGLLNDDLSGFYKIKYQRQNSNETT